MKKVIICDQTQEVLYPETLDGFVNSVILTLLLRSTKILQWKDLIFTFKEEKFCSICSEFLTFEVFISTLPPGVRLMKSNHLTKHDFWKNCRKRKTSFSTTMEGNLFSYGFETYPHCSNLSLSQGHRNSFPFLLVYLPTAFSSCTWTPSYYLEEPHYLWQLHHPPTDRWLPLHAADFPKAYQI